MNFGNFVFSVGLLSLGMKVVQAARGGRLRPFHLEEALIRWGTGVFVAGGVLLILFPEPLPKKRL